MKQDVEGSSTQINEPTVHQRLYHAAKAAWKLAAIVAVFFLIVLSTVLFLLRSAVPATTTYFARFEFKFPGVESGRFPSGDVFSLNEIIEPAVVGPIYDRFKLDSYKIDRGEFFNALSIRPYIPQETEIIERFQQQLADRRLTITERERIEARLRSALDQGSRSGAEVALTLRRTIGIPRELGRSIVQAVPQMWSQYAIEKRGVLRLPNVTASDVAISAQDLSRASLPLGLVMLSQASDRLQARLTNGSRIAGIQTLVEPLSRRSFRDLENDFLDLAVFQINPLIGTLSLYAFEQGLDEVRLLVQQRITELRTESNFNSGIASALSTNVTQFVDSIATLKGRSEARRGVTELSNSQSNGATTTIPQLSENFIDKLVEMSGRGREADENLQRRISDLTARQLQTAEKLVAIKVETEKWEYLLDKLSVREQRLTLDAQGQARLKDRLLSVSKELNRQWDLLNTLESEFAANRLSHTAKLYNLFLTLPDTFKYDPFFNVAAISLVFAASWFVFLAVWAIRVLVIMNRHRRI